MENAKEIEHFAHEHRLILYGSKEEIRRCCNACGIAVLSSPHYFCAVQDCEFYLHQACTMFPRTVLDHDFHEDDFYNRTHCLVLSTKPRDDNRVCRYCRTLCKNFTYHCSGCDFAVHPRCYSRLDIRIEHMSHPQHPMVAMRKEASLLCDVCGREHRGCFFSCNQCDFWIHQDCALLPTFVKVEGHVHHLSLLYSGSGKFHDRKCLICRETVFRRFGFFFCTICYSPAHVDCTNSHMKDSGAIPHLPMMLDDTFPSSMVRTRVKEMAIQKSNSKEYMLEKYHADHSSVLIDGSTAQESICSACIKPISPPYYNCSAQTECDFLLHTFCADLPLSIKHPFDESNPGTLGSPRWDGFFSLFQCCRCKKYNNGFGYAFSGIGDVDLHCALAPMIIKHDSHEQHPLILTRSHNFLYYRESSSCCSKISVYKYYCSVCMFGIHIDCAHLPETVTHKFDEHPLSLRFTSSSQHHSNSTDHFCEFCEEDIDPKYWFYHCTQCENSFHVNCIPSTGEYSRIKFGGTMKVPCHSDHPLTLVRTMSVCSQTCGFCHKIIEGFKDGVALNCAGCDFWIHLNCGYKSSGAVVPSKVNWLKPFS